MSTVSNLQCYLYAVFSLRIISPTHEHVFWLLHWDDIMFLFVWSMESMHVEIEIGLLRSRIWGC